MLCCWGKSFRSKLVFWSKKAYLVLHCEKRFHFQAYTATLEFCGFLPALKKHRYCIVMEDDSWKLINKKLVFLSPSVLFKSSICMKYDFLVLLKKNHDGFSQWPPQREKELTPSFRTSVLVQVIQLVKPYVVRTCRNIIVGVSFPEQRVGAGLIECWKAVIV